MSWLCGLPNEWIYVTAVYLTVFPPYSFPLPCKAQSAIRALVARFGLGSLLTLSWKTMVAEMRKTNPNAILWSPGVAWNKDWLTVRCSPSRR